jgi:hypothetical protein
VQDLPKHTVSVRLQLNGCCPHWSLQVAGEAVLFAVLAVAQAVYYN